MSETTPFKIAAISEAEFNCYWIVKGSDRDQPTAWFRDESSTIIGRVKYDRWDGPSRNIAWCWELMWKDKSGQFTNKNHIWKPSLSSGHAASDALMKKMAQFHLLLTEGGGCEFDRWKTDDIAITKLDVQIVPSTDLPRSLEEKREKHHVRSPQKGSNSRQNQNTRENYKVTVGQDGIAVPPGCNCCFGAAEKTELISCQYTIGKDTHTYSQSLPLCKRCFGHRGSLTLKIFTLTVIAVIAGFWAAVCLRKIWPFVPPLYVWGSTFAASAGTILWLNLVFPFRGVTSEHGSSENSASIDNISGGNVTFEFANYNYAALFAASNHSKVEPVTRWEHSRTRVFPFFSKSNVYVLLWAGLILSIGTWCCLAESNATLYVDNGYSQNILLELGGKGPKILLLPGTAILKDFPVDKIPYAIKTEKGGLINPSFLNVTSSGNWLFNPEGLDRYVIEELRYGYPAKKPGEEYFGGLRGSGVRNLGNPILTKITADYIFFKPPDKILS
ncbi:MAG: hypothetical protein WCP55_14050, partial [Lentisphaerota bacterium]